MIGEEVDTLEIDGSKIKHEYKHKHEHKHKYHHDEEHKMKEHVNVFAGTPSYGAGCGGWGGNITEGLLLGLIAGRGGLFGGGYGGYGAGCGYGANGVQLVDTAVDIETLTKLGDVQGEINAAALGIQNSLLEQTIANQQGFAGVNAGICAVNGSVKDAAYAISTAISNDGDKTRALITANHISDLERQLTVAQNALSENAHELRRQNDRREIEITMINNQNQNNLQVAQQNGLLSQLASCLARVEQDARITSVAVNNGSGAQVASPNNTNNNTNV